MKILVTGSKGFLGANLIVFLKEIKDYEILEIERSTSEEKLFKYLDEADFIFHLAGVNRPQHESEYMEGNYYFTKKITDYLKFIKKSTPILFSSSIQSQLDNPYGQSKLHAEHIIIQYAESTNALYYIYRLPNLFGKWSKPNYNSFIATFCYNILNDLPIVVNNEATEVKLSYIDDVCWEFLSLLAGNEKPGIKYLEDIYTTTIGEVAKIIRSFKAIRTELVVPHVGCGLIRALYATYLSYMNVEQFSYSIPQYYDERGVFSEVVKTKESGQFSFFTAKPGITRGGHSHHTKNEKFLVLKGRALFKFKNINTGDYYKLEISDDKKVIVQTVPGWTHDITNVGDDDLIVMLWANEIFDRNKPDTISMSLME